MECNQCCRARSEGREGLKGEEKTTEVEAGKCKCCRREMAPCGGGVMDCLKLEVMLSEDLIDWCLRNGWNPAQGGINTANSSCMIA